MAVVVCIAEQKGGGDNEYCTNGKQDNNKGIPVRNPCFINSITGNGNHKESEEIMEKSTDIIQSESGENNRSQGALDQAESGYGNTCLVYVMNLVVFQMVKFHFFPEKLFLLLQM